MKRAKSKDKPVYAFIRVGNRLIPEMDYDLAALEGIAQNERVRVEIKQWRSMPRLRAYWAMLQDVVKSQEPEYIPSAEALHLLVKMKCGLVDFILLPDGTDIAVPGSIALENLPEDQMVAYFRRAEKYLAETFGYVREAA